MVNAKGNDALLGVDSLGINFYSVEDKFNPKVSFPWSEIAKISATKTEFVVSCTSNKIILKAFHFAKGDFNTSFYCKL